METLLAGLLFFAALSAVSAGGDVERIKGPATLDATPGEFPYLVTILDRWTHTLIGSGVLIRSRVVLTAAGIVKGKSQYDVYVVLGVHDRSDWGEETRQSIPVLSIHEHPEFERSFGLTGDIALLRLEREPELGKKKRVQVFGVKNIIESSDEDEDEDILGDSDSCVVPGYGITEWSEFETVLPETLKKFIPEMKKQRYCFGPYLRKKWFCSINSDLTGACKYDYGSPLLCMKDGGYKLYAMTMGDSSFASSRYCDDGFSLFTRTSTFSLWIKRTANLLQRGIQDDD